MSASATTDLVVLPVVVSGALTAGAGVLRYPVPFNCDVLRVDTTVNTAPTGADLHVNLKKNGTTILASDISITAGSNAATPLTLTPGVSAGASVIGGEVPNTSYVASFAAGDYLTVDIDQIGSTVAGSNLVVNLLLGRK